MVRQVSNLPSGPGELDVRGRSRSVAYLVAICQAYHIVGELAQDHGFKGAINLPLSNNLPKALSQVGISIEISWVIFMSPSYYAHNSHHVSHPLLRLILSQNSVPSPVYHMQIHLNIKV